MGSVAQTWADSISQLLPFCLRGSSSEFLGLPQAQMGTTPTHRAPMPTWQILGLLYLQEILALGGFSLSSDQPQAQGQSCGSLFS